MALLILGIALWIGIHLLPSVGIRLKHRLVEQLGLLTYRAAFAGCIILALGLIVQGWQSARPVSIYIPPYSLRPLAITLAVLAFVMLGTTFRASRIYRFIRFPQLWAVIVWAAAHLLANGDSRSLVLFPGMALWAVIMITVISRRDTDWQPPAAPSWTIEILGVVVMLAVALAVIVIHPQFTGMPVL